MKEVTLYEVYSRAAIRRPIAGMVRLHWTRNKEYAISHAKDWGGCVVKLRAIVTSWKPLQRGAPSSQEIIYIAPTTASPWDSGIDVHQLRGRLMGAFGGRIPRYKHRKK
jgi:hypothetical protein